MTLEEFRAWKGDLVTKDFFQRVEAVLIDCDSHVHNHLQKNELNEAAMYNAAMAIVKEIQLIPEFMEKDILEGSNE